MKEKENINANKQKLESKDLKTGTNTKEIKLSYHGDEIMYEVRHRLGIQEYYTIYNNVYIWNYDSICGY